MHIQPVAEEVMFEVIAEPQEQSEQAHQEVRENPAPGPVEPSTKQQPEGKPRYMTYYFKLWMFITCALHF